MRKYLEVIKHYWERTVLAAALLFAFILLGARLLGRSGDDDVLTVSRATLKREDILQPGAFDFLKQDALPDPLQGRNPFSAPIEAPAPKRPRPPKTQRNAPKPKPTPTPAPKPAPVPKQEPTPQPPPKPVVQLPPAIAGRLTFTYQTLNQSGKTMAIVTAQRKGMPATSLTVQVGGEYLGMKVIAISESAIRVRDARGYVGNIPLGEARNLWLKAE